MPSVADLEKRSVALFSLLAAVGLTTIKLIVGLLTGSLGILAEAAHSGLDLVASAATYFAVRIAGRPADSTHNYGHGKVENLSALFETGLLVATCLWVAYAAILRLVSRRVEVEVTVWSFAVIVTSIVVDVSRSRALFGAARKHRSQALEADAIHFQTDIWSSCVVLVGLTGVLIGRISPQLAFLAQADAVAALAVAGIATSVSVRLGIRSIDALLDAAPAGMERRIIAAVESLAGIANCHNVRVRYSGPQLFVDAHILLDGDLTLRRAHDLTEQVESVIRNLAPEADVTVHPEPADVHAA